MFEDDFTTCVDVDGEDGSGLCSERVPGKHTYEEQTDDLYD